MHGRGGTCHYCRWPSAQGPKSKKKKLRFPIAINRRSEKKTRSNEDSRIGEIAIIAIFDFRFRKISGAKNVPNSSLFHIDRCDLGWRLMSHLLFRHFVVSVISNDHLSPEFGVDLRRDGKFLPVEEMICLETTIPGLFYLNDAMSSQRQGMQGRYAAIPTQSARL